ncbi:MAG: hypothetical protein ACK5IQ_01620 [Bacteroidales bacterium]
MGEEGLEIMKDLDETFDERFAKLKDDPDGFQPIKDIVGSDFISFVNCKEHTTVLKSLGESVKTGITRVKVINLCRHILVLTEGKLHYIEYEPKSQKATEHWEFSKENITELSVGKGTTADSLKSSLTGGDSGNSQLQKIKFKSKDKKYEFFFYPTVDFGHMLPTRKSTYQLNFSKEEVTNMEITKRVADLFCKEVVKLGN